MKATVIPFPLVKHRALINRHANAVSQYVRQGDPDIAKIFLEQQLNVQRKKLDRRGVDAAIIEREISALRRAIVSLTHVECVA